jgi:hypothetical protein
VMTPHSSKMNSSVKPKASRSDPSTASAKSIVFVRSRESSQIWDAGGATRCLLSKKPAKMFFFRNTLSEWVLNKFYYKFKFFQMPQIKPFKNWPVWPGVNPTIVSYNARVVKFFTTLQVCSLLRCENKYIPNVFFYFVKTQKHIITPVVVYLLCRNLLQVTTYTSSNLPSSESLMPRKPSRSSLIFSSAIVLGSILRISSGRNLRAKFYRGSTLKWLCCSSVPFDLINFDNKFSFKFFYENFVHTFRGKKLGKRYFALKWIIH